MPDDHVTKEFCSERHKNVEDKLNYIGGVTKGILVTLILEVMALGFIALKGYITHG